MVEIKLPLGVWSYDPDKIFGVPGGFGSVFAGHSSSGAPVAVKKLHLGAAEAAHRELEMVSAFVGKDLEHVVPVLDAGQDANSEGYFVVMPIATCSLQDRLNQVGSFSEFEARDILSGIVKGLMAASTIVHRDLKPGNVLLINGSWCVADFGIARFVEESTSARTLKGFLSPHYAAPEQWRFEHATPATDVYALGCVAFTLLSGRPPFDGTESEICEKHLHSTPPIPADWSGQMRMLVSMMMRKESGSRPDLSRVLGILENIPDEKPFEKLVSAAVEHERKINEAEALRQKTIDEQKKRDALAQEAKSTLRDIFDMVATKIVKVVPSASVKKEISSTFVKIGEGMLELDLKSGEGAISPRDFSRSKWDVVCGAIVNIKQSSEVKRGANLWYTRMNNPNENYRWYEVGYQLNPAMGKRFMYEPAAVAPHLADVAHSPIMSEVQVAYQPIPVDDEDADAFCKRWADYLGEACAGKL